jgi:hypothetical protein
MKNTKKIILTLFTILILSGNFGQVFSQMETDSDTAANLDLHAVAELFKESENVEAFEKSLNDAEDGINNLDLNDDGEVDAISVAEMVSGDTHLLILRVPVAENDFQDVATIAVEKTADDRYDLEIQGNVDFYGVNYYIVPATVNLTGWRIFGWLYRPAYHPYRSVFGYRVYPRWWKPRRAVAVNVYRARTVRFVGRTFTTANTRRVKSIGKINYTPRTSNKVVVKRNVVRTNNQKTIVKKDVKVMNNNRVNKGKTVKTRKRGF